MIDAMVADILNTFEFDPADNHFYDAETGEQLGFQFHPEERRFVTIEGRDILFRPINSQRVFQWMETYRQKHEPEMPRERILIAENEYSYQGNPGDPFYVRAMNNYNRDIGVYVLERMLSLGCRIQVPDLTPLTRVSPEDDFSDLDELWDFADELDTNEIDWKNKQSMVAYRHKVKYLYVMSLLSDDKELAAFLTIIQGQNMPTRNAVAVAEERFQSDDQSKGHSELSGETTTS